MKFDFEKSHCNVPVPADSIMACKLQNGTTNASYSWALSPTSNKPSVPMNKKCCSVRSFPSRT